MTETTVLLTDLAAAGVTITAHGDRIRFHPRNQVSPELLNRLRTHKAELLAHLAEPQTTIVCPWCRATDLAERPEGWLCDRCKRLAWIRTENDDWTIFERADCVGQVYCQPWESVTDPVTTKRHTPKTACKNGQTRPFDWVDDS